jgi:hypothetical protein
VEVLAEVTTIANTVSAVLGHRYNQKEVFDDVRIWTLCSGRRRLLSLFNRCLFDHCPASAGDRLHHPPQNARTQIIGMSGSLDASTVNRAGR